MYHAELASALQSAQVQADEHLPDVLRFPPGTDLHDHPLVKTSCLILQVHSAVTALACLLLVFSATRVPALRRHVLPMLQTCVIA